jgi:hypothetical protein
MDKWYSCARELGRRKRSVGLPFKFAERKPSTIPSQVKSKAYYERKKAARRVLAKAEQGANVDSKTKTQRTTRGINQRLYIPRNNILVLPANLVAETANGAVTRMLFLGMYNL